MQRQVFIDQSLIYILEMYMRRSENLLRTVRLPVMCTLLASTMTACIPLDQMEKPQEAPTEVTMTCAEPKFTPVVGTTDSQEKGGIRIIVSMAPYTCNKTEKVESAIVEHSIADVISARSQYPAYNPQTSQLVLDTHVPVLVVSPKTVIFKITIKNNLSRVFRGTGALVYMNISGKSRVLDQQQYSELSGLILPPQSEQTVTITGPALKDIPENTKIGLNLYDVTVKSDAAGNPTQRENFEWYYNYTTTPRQEQGTVTKSKRWTN